jgi:hypothetical protein
MFSNRPYLPIHFQVLVVLYTSSTCFQDLSGCDFGTGSVFCSHKKRLHMAEMPITTVPHAHHLFENQRARLVWIRVQVEIRIQYIYGHPYYIYTYVYSYNILLYIDIYIYVVNSIYLHDTRSRRKTLELPDSPWHPNSSPKADHRKPCRALMSRIFRWGPDSHWEPQSLWRRQIPCFLSVFPCLFHLHTEFETPSKGSLNPMSTHHFSSCRSVESTHYMYDSTMNQMTMLVFDHCLRILAVLCCFNHGA